MMTNGSESPTQKRLPRWIWIILLIPLVVWFLARPFFKNESEILIGKPAPELRVVTLAGKTIQITELRGKALLLNFWASWCGPCMAEFPSLKELELRFKGKPFEILLVNVDETYEDVASTVPLATLPGRVLFGASFQSLSAYEVRMLPLTILIDAQGVVRNTIMGGYNWNEPKLIQEVEKLISLP
jgi:thiol-disulfide isomerase/thioredoxin